MAKTKSVHSGNGKASIITFPSAKIAEFGRVDPASGWIKFQCALNDKSLATLFGHMGWDQPGELTQLEKLDGKLVGGNLILTSKDKLVDAEVEVDFKAINSFACHRFELEGRKKKGFRRELRFSASFEDVEACAKLESYMTQCDNARGSLKVTYYPAPEQTEMPLQSEEARQATLPESD